MSDTARLVKAQALLLAGVMGLLASLAVGQAGSALVVKAGKVITVAGVALEPGAVLVRDGRIAAIGAEVEVPEGARVIDVPDGVVMPGLVLAHSQLVESQRGTDESVAPELRISDGLDLYADWRDLLADGITSVYFAPTGRRAMPGQGAVVKLGAGGPSARILRDPGALEAMLGEWPKRPPDLWDPPLPPTPDEPSAPPRKQLPTTRVGEMALLREVFTAVRDGLDSEVELGALRREALQRALDGEVPVRVCADRAEDLRNALALAEEFGLRLVIRGGVEAYAVSEELARKGVPVVLTPTVLLGQVLPTDLEGPFVSVKGEARSDNAAILMDAGVKVAIGPLAAADLLETAAFLIGNGAPEERALRAITIDAAEILGVADRLGTIEVGKDGDLVVLTGEPFATRSLVQTTISDGQVVYERKADAGDATARLRIIRAREIWTGTGGPLRDSEIWVRDGAIESVRDRGDTPAEAEVIDLGDRAIMPGMIDMHSHLGLHWETEGVTLSPAAPTTGPGSGGPKHVSIANAMDPTDEAFEDAVRAGVTSVVLAPAASGLFCGSVAVIKTAGDIAERIVKPVAALKFSLLGDRDRSARIWSVRDLLEKVKKYDADWEEFDSRWPEFERKHAAEPEEDLDEPGRPERKSEYEMMRVVFRERAPVFVAAERTDEMRTAVKVFRQEFGLETILLGASDGDRIAEELATNGVAASVGPQVVREERGREVNQPAALVQAGVPVAFQSMSTSGTQHLRTTAAMAVRHGMEPGEALRALTSSPAKLLGLGHRIGTIEPGRDADLVALSGHPLELTSQVEKVFVNGELVYDAEAPQ